MAELTRERDEAIQTLREWHGYEPLSPHYEDPVIRNLHQRVLDILAKARKV